MNLKNCSYYSQNLSNDSFRFVNYVNIKNMSYNVNLQISNNNDSILVNINETKALSSAIFNLIIFFCIKHEQYDSDLIMNSFFVKCQIFIL